MKAKDTSSTFSAETDFTSFVANLKQSFQTNPVSRYLWSQLSAVTKSGVSNYDGSMTPELQQSLVKDLNQIIQNGALYDAQRFAGTMLSAKTQSLLAKNVEGESGLVRLNRILLEDAYHPFLPKKVQITADLLFQSHTKWNDVSTRLAFRNIKNQYRVFWGKWEQRRCHPGEEWILSSEFNYANVFGTDALRKDIIAYFELLRYFYESDEPGEHQFACATIRALPGTINCCFESLKKEFHFCSVKGLNQTKNDLERDRSYFFDCLSLALESNQFEFVDYLFEKMVESEKEFTSKPVELMTKSETPSEEYLPSLFATILDNVKIRPLFQFINNYDLLPSNVQTEFTDALFQILKNRFPKLPSGPPTNAAERGKLRTKEILDSLILDRRSLIDSIIGSERTDELLGVK